MFLAVVLKACALLSAADILAVMGEAPAKVRPPAPQVSVSKCAYALPKSRASISVEVTPGPQAQQVVDRLREAARVEGDETDGLDQPAIERIEGLGDEAFFALGSGKGSLYVWRRKTLFWVSVENGDTVQARLKKLRQLARRLLAHLPA